MGGEIATEKRGKGDMRRTLALFSTLAFIVATPPLEAQAHHYSYNSDMGFRSFSYQRIQGTHDDDGGCTFSDSGLADFKESDADYLNYGAEEVSYYEDTCRSQFKVGPLTEDWGDSPPESGGVTTDDTGEEEAAGLEGPEPEPCPTFDPCMPETTRTQPDRPGRGSKRPQTLSASSTTWYPRKQLYSSIAWEDPVEIDVNKSEVWLNFRSTDGCAGAASIGHRARHYWLSETDWSRTHAEGGLDGPFCTYVARWSNARFVNNYFCDGASLPIGASFPAAQTRTRMWPNRAIGLPAGRHKPVRSWSKAGGCQGLLSVELKWKVRRV